MAPAPTRGNSALAASLRVSLSRLSRRLRTEQTDSPPVSIGGLAVLGRLDREGEVTLGRLAAAERVRPPSMTRTVRCLEDEGLLERFAHPTDGRQVLVRLSPAGADLLRAERRRRDAWLALRLQELTPDERDVLRRAAPILERLSNA